MEVAMRFMKVEAVLVRETEKCYIIESLTGTRGNFVKSMGCRRLDENNPVRGTELFEVPAWIGQRYEIAG
jgi:hypothetical protein